MANTSKRIRKRLDELALLFRFIRQIYDHESILTLKKPPGKRLRNRVS